MVLAYVVRTKRTGERYAVALAVVLTREFIELVLRGRAFPTSFVQRSSGEIDGCHAMGSGMRALQPTVQRAYIRQ